MGPPAWPSRSIIAASRAARPSFFRGTGAIVASVKRQPKYNQASRLTSVVLLDIELSQQSHRLVPPPSSFGLISAFDIASVAWERRGLNGRHNDVVFCVGVDLLHGVLLLRNDIGGRGCAALENWPHDAFATLRRR